MIRIALKSISDTVAIFPESSIEALALEVYTARIRCAIAEEMYQHIGAARKPSGKKESNARLRQSPQILRLLLYLQAALLLDLDWRGTYGDCTSSDARETECAVCDNAGPLFKRDHDSGPIYLSSL